MDAVPFSLSLSSVASSSSVSPAVPASHQCLMTSLQVAPGGTHAVVESEETPEDGRVAEVFSQTSELVEDRVVACGQISSVVSLRSDERVDNGMDGVQCVLMDQMRWQLRSYIHSRLILYSHTRFHRQLPRHPYPHQTMTRIQQSIRNDTVRHLLRFHFRVPPRAAHPLITQRHLAQCTNHPPLSTLVHLL